jgi:3D (Asp-Asp-Asp) domain-containing protein
MILTIVFSLGGNYVSSENCSVSARMNISAYTDCSAMASCWGITASGRKTSVGTVAAGKDVPFEMRAIIPRYGLGRIEDRGGAITNEHLDVWYKELGDALDFGRRSEIVIFF